MHRDPDCRRRFTGQAGGSGRCRYLGLILEPRVQSAVKVDLEHLHLMPHDGTVPALATGPGLPVVTFPALTTMGVIAANIPIPGPVTPLVPAPAPAPAPAPSATSSPIPTSAPVAAAAVIPAPVLAGTVPFPPPAPAPSAARGYSPTTVIAVDPAVMHVVRRIILFVCQDPHPA